MTLFEQIQADPIDFIRRLLELGWPAIVLFMVFALWVRINQERDRREASQNGHMVALEASLRQCHADIERIIREHDAQAEKLLGEVTTQVANLTLMERQNRDDILAIKGFVEPKG